jgi:REP element-mobilizing transposase RayT
METLCKGQYNAYQIHYHFVTPIKYRKAIFEYKERCNSLIEITKGIEERYEIKFEQVGIDANHVHYLLSSSPKFSPAQIIRVLKSI